MIWTQPGPIHLLGCGAVLIVVVITKTDPSSPNYVSDLTGRIHSSLSQDTAWCRHKKLDSWSVIESEAVEAPTNSSCIASKPYADPCVTDSNGRNNASSPSDSYVHHTSISTGERCLHPLIMNLDICCRTKAQTHLMLYSRARQAA